MSSRIPFQRTKMPARLQMCIACPDAGSHLCHNRIFGLFFLLTQTQINLFRFYLMLFHIRDKARKPDGRRSCCHTCKQICLVSRPQRKKPGKRITSDIIRFTLIYTQLPDFIQCLRCPVSKFFCSIYSWCFPWCKFLIPRVHLCRNKRKWSFGHFLYLSDFVL